MSTRCNIIIQNGKSRTFIYRHSDGYLTATGLDIQQKLRAHPDATSFVRALLTEMYEATSYCAARPVYELTTNVHGDIEWLYLVKFDESGVKVAAMQCGFAASGTPIDPEQALACIRAGDMSDFIRAINREARETNERIKKLRIEQPAHYGSMELLAEVRA